MARTPEEKLRNPRPGGYIAEARDYGIDLTQLIENLRLTPAQRIKNNDGAVNSVRKIAEAVKRAKLLAKQKKSNVQSL
ncbi:MAG TPA: hypothetical protein PKD24_13185 [Pyrinomonadaceae bacterium]|jgi:hypothetical protein|nr:hypothetical protein [Pyrinomonadaceae bacterium]HMP66361.1 hypothetical protein [Pyrinomonadaceae bacterium]